MEDYKKDWCRVREMDMPDLTTRVYNETVKYYGLVSILKRHFGMLRPDPSSSTSGRSGGDDLDFDALVETLVERHAGWRPPTGCTSGGTKSSGRIGGVFSRHEASAPATYCPRQAIIDVERDGLVLMAEALESIRDRWAVSHYREGGLW
ncbi:MAG: hypothetical protein U0411_00540 [Thermodesulfovibrionales bacterium]